MLWRILVVHQKCIFVVHMLYPGQSFFKTETSILIPNEISISFGSGISVNPLFTGISSVPEIKKSKPIRGYSPL